MMQWEQLLSPHRVGSTEAGKITRDRSPFQRDFDRIVFSGSFRRLQDKTQVFPLVKQDYVRTRLTHSLEASSIGRSLGTAIGDEVVKNCSTGDAHPSDFGAAVAAAALAHDIGNPPLGHAGEEAIRHWFTHSPFAEEMRREMTAEEAADIENYEGNAQGFRVLTHLEMPDCTGGMQLTCATLGAFAKYPCPSLPSVRPQGVAGKKFNYFQSEAALFAEVAEATGMEAAGPGAWQRHPLAFLVEAADDIAYRIVDFEDGARLGLIDQQELEARFLELINSSRSAEYVKTLHSPVRRAEFLRAKAIGVLVQELKDIFLAHHDEILAGRWLTPLIDSSKHAETLKLIEKRSASDIYHHRKVAEIVGAGFEMVSGMLDIFVPCANELALERAKGIKAGYRARRIGALLPEVETYCGNPLWCSNAYFRLMTILDYVSGMTDTFAVSLYQKLKGISL